MLNPVEYREIIAIESLALFENAHLRALLEGFDDTCNDRVHLKRPFEYEFSI